MDIETLMLAVGFLLTPIAQVLAVVATTFAITTITILRRS